MGLSQTFPWGAPAFSEEGAAPMIALPRRAVVKSGSVEFTLNRDFLYPALLKRGQPEVTHTPCGWPARTGPSARRAGW